MITKKIIVTILFFACTAFSLPNQNIAELKLGAGFGHSVYLPLCGLSIGWLNSERLREVGTEFGFGETPNSTKFNEVGLVYSYLYNVTGRNLFMGPSLGIVAVLDYADTYVGNYLVGCKAAYLRGNNRLKVVVSNRLLAGFVDKGSYKFTLLNVASLGTLIFF